MKIIIVLLLSVVVALGGYVVVYDSGSTPVASRVLRVVGPVSPETITGPDILVFNTARTPAQITTLRTNGVPMKFWLVSGRNIIEMSAFEQQSVLDAEAAQRVAEAAALEADVRQEATNILSIQIEGEAMAFRGLAEAIAEIIELIRTVPATPPVTGSNLLWIARQKITDGDVD